jgi:chromosome partitioning protein
MQPIGYIFSRQIERLFLPMELRSQATCMAQTPGEYRESVLGEPGDDAPHVSEDPWCLAHLKYYFGLTIMAENAHKAMFNLRAADGAMGGSSHAVLEVEREFRDLAREIAKRAQIEMPPWPPS